MKRIVFVALVSAAVAVLSLQLCFADVTPDQAYIDSVINDLVAAGVLTADQAAAMKTNALAAAGAVTAAQPAPKKPKKKWYDTVKVSGYIQGRWQNYPDKTKQPKNEFFIRRARAKVTAKPGPGLTLVIQPDYAGGKVSVKDAWIQKAFAPTYETRARLGQQQLPFGFETPQSSSKRLPLERNWVARRTILGERDTGLTIFHTPKEDKALFDLAKKHHLGTGDYGTYALGIYNGQGAGTGIVEVNNDKHFIARIAKPFLVDNFLGGDGDQYVELGASYYSGDYMSAAAAMTFSEDLLGVHAYAAPQPFGLQAEYYDGKTEGHDLDGWYVMPIVRTSEDGIAFVRYDEMNGWRKGKNVDYSRHRWSIGYAHQVDKKTRVTVEYDVESLDTPGGGDNDLFGIQMMTTY